jgi:hypothetical protein
MSFMDAYKAYGALNSEQKNFLREKRIEATHPPDAWLALIGGAARYDRLGDALRKGIGWTGAIALILAFISLFTGVVIAIVVLLLIAVVAFSFFAMLKRVDLPDSIHDFILPMITLLREDMEPDEPLHLKIDLRDGTRDERKLESRSLPSHGGRSITQTIYNNPWMSGDSTLADGSALSWELSDRIRERKVTRRNPRGKIKTKTKYKVRRLIDVRVGLKRGDYVVEGTMGKSGNNKIAMKPGEKRNVIRVRRALITSDPNAPLDVKEFIDPIAEAYKKVSLNNEGEGK